MTDKTINWVFRATDRTTEAFRSIDSKIAGISRALKTFGGFAGFAAIATTIGTMTKALVEMGSELNDASEKLGINVEALQVLKFAAEQTGASFDSIQTALAFNSKLTLEAASGNKEAADTFRQLGIDAKKFADLPLEKRFAVAAEQISQVTNKGDQLALTLKFMGRSAADLVPLFANGAAAINSYKNELEDANAIMSGRQSKVLEKAGDDWDKLILRLKVGAVPAFVAVIDWIGKTSDAIGNLSDAIRKIPQFKLPGQDQKVHIFEPGGGTGSWGPPVKPRAGATGSWGEERKPATKRVAPLTPEEAAAVVGLPGKKSLDAANATMAKALATFNEVIADSAKERARTAAKSRDDYADEVSKVVKDIDALSREADSFFSDRAKELSSQFEDPLEKLKAQILEINNLFSAGLIDSGTAERAAKEYGDAYAAAIEPIVDKNTEVKDSVQEMFDALKLSTDGYARDLTDAFFDATQTIGDYFKNLAETIAKALFTQAVTEPLISSILGSIAGSLGGSSSTSGSSTQYTRRAIGGPVNTGVPVLVGEQGPEMFIPKTSGTIIPHGISKRATVLAQTIASKIFVNPKIEKQINNILSAPARAMGGPVHLGTTYLVGERGPEIFIKSGGTIINNSATDRLINVAHNLTTSTDNRRSNAAHNLTTITDNRREFDLSSAITKAAYVTFINNQSKSILSLAGFKLPAALSAPPVRRATGGPVHPWTAYLVGERGPEIFIPSTSTTVTNNQTDRVINQAKTMVSNHRTENVLSQSQTTNNQAEKVLNVAKTLVNNNQSSKVFNQAEKVLNVAKTLVNNNQSSKVFNQASTLIKTTQTDSVLNRQTNLLTNNVINRNSHSSLFETISRASTINHGDPQITNVLKLIGFKVPAAPLPARAMGGPVSAGSSYLVGESGPELFVPHTGGTIVPNAADGDTIQVNMTINSIDPYTAAQTIANQERLITGMIRKATRRAGRRPALA